MKEDKKEIRPIAFVNTINCFNQALGRIYTTEFPNLLFFTFVIIKGRRLVKWKILPAYIHVDLHLVMPPAPAPSPQYFVSLDLQNHKVLYIPILPFSSCPELNYYHNCLCDYM